MPAQVFWKLDDAPRKLEHVPAQVFWKLDDAPRKLEHVPDDVLSRKLKDAPRKLEPLPTHEHEDLSFESVHVKRIEHTNRSDTLAATLIRQLIQPP